ncbi:MAG TPA: hypothetical protein VFW06_07665 [Acidimicrobiia bacterium]|nr:hypothetical protein [Acidimicrobiia bacterium]
MSPVPLSRRAFLAGTGGVIAAATIARPLGAIPAKRKPLSPLVLSSDLHASPDPQRLAFAIAKGSNFASTAPAQVVLTPPGSIERVVLDTTLHKAGLPKGRGVYVSEPVLDVPGVWGAVALTRGRELEFAIQVKEAPEAPAIGTAAPLVASPTKSDRLGVAPICTRVPRCPLHASSLADLAGTGRPIAVLFATPALCQSAYCGPVLDELLEVKPGYEDRVDFVHVEIYRSNTGADISPTVEAWGLPSEPWLYTIDASGTITARLDGAFGGDEMTTALDAVGGA